MLFLSVNFAIINLLIEGGGGIATTRLASGITSSSTTIPVGSVQGFLSSDIIYIDNEAIYYEAINTVTNTFGTVGSPVVRGYRSTTASSHSSGARVMNSGTSALNQLVGYNVVEAASGGNDVVVLTQTGWALVRAIPRIITWDFAILDGPGVYIKYILLYPLSAALVISFFVVLSSSIMGIFGAFRR